jgi:dolichyl-phosphate-mannose--protein O-mannosyl transferase
VSSDAYAVTATNTSIDPTARSVFTIQNVESDDASIRYGCDVRLSCVINDKEVYLNSLPITPMTYAKYSRNQEVSLYYKKAYNTVWRIQPSTGSRQDKQGEPVCCHDQIILEHVATANYLSNDHIVYQNSYGRELEVSCMAQSTKHKTQILLNESQGALVRDNVNKQVNACNLWKFRLAANEAEAQ